ncbi:hypothetical protein [Amycolatopsis taiwanensis]|uniref:Uncharacterized protein n=1 Tax=Amycolatopsis taiwanensis TaxID=342230 RepID=A0A9W6VDM3_9PSEU|nr:hypothetical protein [Amycolatopsis taiwanensis]GLY63607.1 hypothetical protein Atai01_02260 [Amycolatopsis taiwanensis]
MTVAVGSLLTTIGTAIVLGYVTPEQIAANSPNLSAQEIDSFLVGYRIVGFVFLTANTVGLLAMRGKTWIFYFVLVLDLVQGIGFLTFDRTSAGLHDLGLIASITTDGGGGVLALVMLGFLVSYRTAWARRRVVTQL